eukprot:m.100185 g.100185  ORF g.100185 m.100185 type:complete len:59 (+) comp27225_c6_seq1:273-449(+)
MVRTITSKKKKKKKKTISSIIGVDEFRAVKVRSLCAQCFKGFVSGGPVISIFERFELF